MMKREEPIRVRKDKAAAFQTKSFLPGAYAPVGKRTVFECIAKGSGISGLSFTDRCLFLRRLCDNAGQESA